MQRQKVEQVFSQYVNKRMQSEEQVNRRLKDNQRMWKSQRKTLEDKFTRIRD